MVDLDKILIDLDKSIFEDKGYYYVGVLTGKYLDDNVEMNRTSFDILENSTEDDVSMDDIILGAKEQVEIYLKEYLEDISSDIPFDNSPKEERTDILILDRPVALSDENNTGREFETIIILELKRPMRDDYNSGDNPIQQLLGYVDKLASNKMTDKNGRIIRVGSKLNF